jgi:glutaredoxin
MKKIITIALIIVGLSVLYVVLSKSPRDVPNTNLPNPDLVLYWGNTCPHCKNVEDYIKSNNLDEKLKINRKEVYDNQDNQKDLASTVNKYCPDLNQGGGIGVPLALDTKTNTCLIGDKPIIDFLSKYK